MIAYTPKEQVGRIKTLFRIPQKASPDYYNQAAINLAYCREELQILNNLNTPIYKENIVHVPLSNYYKENIDPHFGKPLGIISKITSTKLMWVEKLIHPYLTPIRSILVIGDLYDVQVSIRLIHYLMETFYQCYKRTLRQHKQELRKYRRNLREGKECGDRPQDARIIASKAYDQIYRVLTNSLLELLVALKPNKDLEEVDIYIDTYLNPDYRKVPGPLGKEIKEYRHISNAYARVGYFQPHKLLP